LIMLLELIGLVVAIWALGVVWLLLILPRVRRRRAEADLYHDREGQNSGKDPCKFKGPIPKVLHCNYAEADSLVCLEQPEDEDAGGRG